MKREKVDLETLSPEEREQRRKRIRRFNSILYALAASLLLTGVYIILNDQTLILKRCGDKLGETYKEVALGETPIPNPTLPPLPAFTVDPNSTYNPVDADDYWNFPGGKEPGATHSILPTQDTQAPNETNAAASAPVAVSTPEPTKSPQPASDTTPGADQTPKPVYGDPEPTPYNPYEPKSVYFVGHDINCPVQPVGYNQYGQMAVVQSAYISGWFRYGGDPVRGGNTLIAGHIRHKGKFGYFSIIRDGLKAGDYVIVEMQNGQYAYYVVSKIEKHMYNNVPNEIMSTGGRARLTLITCQDDYSSYYGTSMHRVFAICYPVYFEDPNPTEQPRSTDAPASEPSHTDEAIPTGVVQTDEPIGEAEPTDEP